MAALTLSINNIPEGIATFIATVANPQIGIIITVATSLQSLLEGTVIAVPIFYATRSRWRSLAAASAAGIAPTIGGAIAYGAVASAPSARTFGAMFGVVSGSLVWIVICELLPAAYRYDKSGRIVPAGIAAGFALVALSSVISGYASGGAIGAPFTLPCNSTNTGSLSPPAPPVPRTLYGVPLQ